MIAFEIEHDRKLMDFVSGPGLMTAIGLMRRLKRGGLQHWDTVCSSWVWVGRNSTGRSFLRPMGLARVPSVAVANCMVSRMALLAMYGLSKRSLFMLEQPSSSLMREHEDLQREPFESMLNFNSWMGAFGGESMKRTDLTISDFATGRAMQRSMSYKTWQAKHGNSKTTRTEYVGGKKKVYGVPRRLKKTQAYPSAYGDAVAMNYIEWKKRQTFDDSSSSSSDYPLEADEWRWADTVSVSEGLARVMPRIRGHY